MIQRCHPKYESGYHQATVKLTTALGVSKLDSDHTCDDQEEALISMNNFEKTGSDHHNQAVTLPLQVFR